MLRIGGALALAGVAMAWGAPAEAPCVRPSRPGTQVQGEVKICPGRYRIADPTERIDALASGSVPDDAVVLDSQEDMRDADPGSTAEIEPTLGDREILQEVLPHFSLADQPRLGGHRLTRTASHAYHNR